MWRHAAAEARAAGETLERFTLRMMMRMIRMMRMMVMRRGMRKVKNRRSREDIIGKANLVKDELTKNAATSTDTMQESL